MPFTQSQNLSGLDQAFEVIEPTEVERRMAIADNALRAAGYEVNDPNLRALRRSVIRGERTVSEAIKSDAILTRTQPHLV